MIIMKAWKKYSTLVCCILTCVLLGEFVHFSEAQGTSHFIRVSSSVSALLSANKATPRGINFDVNQSVLDV